LGQEATGLVRRRRRTPLVVLGLIAAAILSATLFGVFRRSVVYYMTPTEVTASPGQRVRVSGTVVAGSISFLPAEGKVSFSLADERSTVRVEYEGAAPDTLKDGAEAVAEGTLSPEGVFRADKLFAKCPSKFEGKTEDKTRGSPP